MGRTLSEWRDEARELLGGPTENEIAGAVLERRVRRAVRRFSQDRPRILTQDYAGNGIAYDLALPPGWVPGFSSVQDVEYPLGDKPARMLDRAEITVYPDISAPTFIRLLATVPATGQSARVHHSIPWPQPGADPATDVITDLDFEAVVGLAAALGAKYLQGSHTGDKPPTLAGADLGDPGSESERWRTLARDLFRDYAEHVGTASGRAPASGQVDWDAAATWPGNRFLFHGGRR